MSTILRERIKSILTNKPLFFIFQYDFLVENLGGGFFLSLFDTRLYKPNINSKNYYDYEENFTRFCCVCYVYGMWRR